MIILWLYLIGAVITAFGYGAHWGWTFTELSPTPDGLKLMMYVIAWPILLVAMIGCAIAAFMKAAIGDAKEKIKR